jgi:hypothetical protein
MVERGKDHLGALCVVAANLAERAWTVMNRGTPYTICDTDGRPITANQARRSSRNASPFPTKSGPAAAARKRGRPPKPPKPGGKHGATFPDTSIIDHHPSTGNKPPTKRPVDNGSSIGNQSKSSLASGSSG